MHLKKKIKALGEGHVAFVKEKERENKKKERVYTVVKIS